MLSMKIEHHNVKRLQALFKEAWLRIKGGWRPDSLDLHTVGPLLDSDFWSVYMNFLDCLMIEREDLLENFDDMVNFGSAVKERICLKDPCLRGDYILVPWELAEKALVLGVLA